MINNVEKKGIRGEILIMITAILWSSGGLFLKLLPDMNALAINGMRSFIAFIVLLLYFKRFPKINKWSILGGVIFSLVNVLFVIANKLTTAANAIVLQYTAPIYVLIFSSIKAKKMPKFTQIAILIVAFLGIVLVFADKVTIGNMLGNILALIAGIAFGSVFFINNMEQTNPVDNACVAFIINVIIGIPFYFKITQFGMSQLLPILGLGILQFGLPYITFSIGIKKCSAFNASIISLLEAILNPIWVYLVVKEKPGVLGIIGCVIVILSIAFNTIYESKVKVKERSVELQCQLQEQSKKQNQAERQNCEEEKNKQ